LVGVEERTDQASVQLDIEHGDSDPLWMQERADRILGERLFAELAHVIEQTD
jgi:hypothetical protein